MSGRVALVTGAAAGIGRATALRLARDGMAVGVLDLDLTGCEEVVSKIIAAGGKGLALGASVADRAQLSAAIAKLRDAFGPVTVLVNNAGICTIMPFEELTDEVWDQTMAVNLKGAFIAVQLVLPDMKGASWGRIVNVSSSGAQTGAERISHYSASKGGMISLTKCLAHEFSPLGITVNTIAPSSVINTKMSDEHMGQGLTPISKETLLATLPVRRMGQPDDIANAVSWVVAEDSSFVTGQLIGVNGGHMP